MNTIPHLILLMCVNIIGRIECARILAYIPTPSISHQLPFRPLTQELANRGHKVVVITPDPAFSKDDASANLTEIDLHDVSYGLVVKNFQRAIEGKKSEFVSLSTLMYSAISAIIDVQLNTNEVKEVLHGPKFDLLLLEAWPKPLIAISHVQKAPVILISSFGTTSYSSEAMGAPVHPILYPLTTRQRLFNLTIWEKIRELFNQYMVVYLFQKYDEYGEKLWQNHFGSDLPPISELMNNVDMLFLNMHPIFEGNFPVPPGVVYMWGIHTKSRQGLPQDLKTFLDSSKHGVVYMSFGTNINPSLLPPEKIQMFVNVFCRLPYDVLWKWDEDELPGRCKNIKIGKWFPQTDVLSHPNIKAFVTQGGLQSTDEAIRAGVPLVGIPMMGDQWHNVEKCVHLNIGVQLDFEYFTEKEFENAVTTVIENNSYRQNIRKLDELMRDQPAPALERAAWWVEHVLQHGDARHLHAPAANISWMQYLELELVALLLLGILVTISFIIVMLRYLYRFIIRNYFTNVKLKS